MLDDLNLHSWLQLYENSRILVSILFEMFAVDLGEIDYDTTTCWFVGAHANLVRTSKIQVRVLC